MSFQSVDLVSELAQILCHKVLLHEKPRLHLKFIVVLLFRVFRKCCIQLGCGNIVVKFIFHP